MDRFLPADEVAGYRAERVASGKPPESQLLITLEDECLVGMTVRDLGWMLEEHARQHPIAGSQRRTRFLDEVQTVPGWEGLFAVDYMTTEEGFGIDFVARRAGQQPVLIQGSLETDEEPTWTREVHALVAAAKAKPRTRAMLLTLDSSPPQRELPGRVTRRCGHRAGSTAVPRQPTDVPELGPARGPSAVNAGLAE